MSSRIGTTFVGIVAVAAVCAPAAWAAKPKLYSVALSGDVRNEASRTTDGTVRPPEGCMGTMSETHRFVASAGLAPKPSWRAGRVIRAAAFPGSLDIADRRGDHHERRELCARPELPARGSERVLVHTGHEELALQLRR